MNTEKPKKTRASTSKAARDYRQRGHDNAESFALEIGMLGDYKRDKKAKKDVIDPAGDAHSVKSGKRKWQIFLYPRSRFLTDDGFQALNGIGQLLIHCIDAFPPKYEDYEGSEDVAKERLKTPMRELKDRLQRKALLRAFLRKSIFNGGEVNYLTILHDEKFHVYWSDDVIEIMADNFEVANSKARKPDETDDQKVVFRHSGRNVGELEMRNDSEKHYAEIRFNMNIKFCISLFENSNLKSRSYSDRVICYGKAVKKFGDW